MDEPFGFSSVFCCTEVLVFCYESCQCISNYGFWNDLNSADLEVFADESLTQFDFTQSVTAIIEEFHKVL